MGWLHALNMASVRCLLLPGLKAAFFLVKVLMLFIYVLGLGGGPRGATGIWGLQLWTPGKEARRKPGKEREQEEGGRERDLLLEGSRRQQSPQFLLVRTKGSQFPSSLEHL